MCTRLSFTKRNATGKSRGWLIFPQLNTTLTVVLKANTARQLLLWKFRGLLLIIPAQCPKTQFKSALGGILPWQSQETPNSEGALESFLDLPHLQHRKFQAPIASCLNPIKISTSIQLSTSYKGAFGFLTKAGMVSSKFSVTVRLYLVIWTWLRGAAFAPSTICNLNGSL